MYLQKHIGPLTRKIELINVVQLFSLKLRVIFHPDQCGFTLPLSNLTSYAYDLCDSYKIVSASTLVSLVLEAL